MTTAGRPTMESARGTDYRGGRMYVPSAHFCKRDATSFTQMKYRQPGQGTEDELLARDLVSELIEREAQAADKAAARSKVGLVIPDLKAIGAVPQQPRLQVGSSGSGGGGSCGGKGLDADDSGLEDSSDDDSDASDDENENNRKDGPEKEEGGVSCAAKVTGGTKGVKRSVREVSGGNDEEDDDDGKCGDNDSDEDEDSDDDDDDDDDDEETAELLAELEKIKKERAEEQARAKAAAEAKSEAEKDLAALVGNPLMAGDEEGEEGEGAGSNRNRNRNSEVRDSFTVTQKWYEDSVFKNQSRGEPDNKKKRFINDTVRNQFHLQFLKKYIT